MKSLTRQELQNMLKSEEKDFVLVNVLDAVHFNKQHIPTSINVPHEEHDFIETIEKIAGAKSRRIVVYCASFECNASQKAAEKLEEAGFRNVYDYEGGVQDWFNDEQQSHAA